MDGKRILKHWLLPPRVTRRRFGPKILAAIASAIAESEGRHRGELRFVAEGRLSLFQLLGGMGARQRALRLFDRLGVANTRERSGILIYVLLAERRVEIVADIGITALVPQAEWDGLCGEMIHYFGNGRWEDGALAGVAGATRLLARHFPAGLDNPNELDDAPLVL